SFPTRRSSDLNALNAVSGRRRGCLASEADAACAVLFAFTQRPIRLMPLKSLALKTLSSQLSAFVFVVRAQNVVIVFLAAFLFLFLPRFFVFVLFSPIDIAGPVP